jgi:two-component system, LytTR family, sensor kinase
MRVPSASDPYLTADLIGFTAGLAISLLLLVLSVRAARIPGTPAANVLFALCALLWNAGGLAHTVLLVLGSPKDVPPALVASATQFTGAAVWPIALLAIWRPLAARPWQKGACRILQGAAAIVGAGITLSFWSAVALGVSVLPHHALKELTSYNGSLLFALGAASLLRGPLPSRAASFASLTMLLGVLGGTGALLAQRFVKLGPDLDAALLFVGKQSVLLLVIGAFLLFARFRFADVFLQQSLRILLAGASAVALVALTEAPFLSEWATRVPFPKAARVFAASLVAAAFLLGFATLDRRLGTLVNRWFFSARDHRSAIRQLGERLRSLYLEPEIRASVEDGVRASLDVAAVKVVDLESLPGSLWPAEIHDGEPVELHGAHELSSLLPIPDVELLAPVRTGTRVSSVIAVAPGPARRGLVSRDVEYLRSAAAQLGARLDLLRLEREMAERQHREALLQQQLTEAELRALRAQVNPHFLFNSLNTIADLIVTNPIGAEAMTLRLAKVFRHVLSRSSRPLTTLADEIAFLRTYLEIEEARFGGRLHVDIDVSADVASESVPSLILQPVVENALRHGLAPKPGPGHLWITARAQSGRVRLMVEDDGVGPGMRAEAPLTGTRMPMGETPSWWGSTGVGLTNVAQRLAAVYRDGAEVSLEPRESGGTRVTIVVPRAAGSP